MVNVANPLEVPYRTGSYLIYDKGSSDNFREMSLSGFGLGSFRKHHEHITASNLESHVSQNGRELSQ